MKNNDIECEVAELRAQASTFQPTTLVAAIYLEEMFVGDRRTRGRREGQIAIAEYVALLLLGSFERDTGAIPTLADVARVTDLARRVFDNALAEIGAFRGAIHSEQDLVARVQSAGVILRNPGEPEHWRHLLGLFAERFDPRIERSLGISLVQVLACFDACVGVATEQYARWNQRVNDDVARLWTAVKKWPRHSGNLPGAELRFVQSLKETGRRKPLRAVKSFAREQALAVVGGVPTLTVESVAARAGQDLTVARRFLDLFSVRADIREDWRLVPSPHNFLTRTPFIRISAGYFLPQPTLLIWSLLPRIEGLINPDSPEGITESGTSYRDYEKCRKSFLERTAVELLSAVGDRQPLQNAIFNATVDGTAKRFEIDGCVRLDTSVYVIECKAGTLSEPTRRGAPLSVQNELARLLGEGAVQLRRGIDCLSMRSGALPEDLKSIAEGAHEFFGLLVTMDHTGAIGSGVSALRNEDLFHAGVFWQIGVLDLYALVSVLKEGWRFKHYTQRRLAIADGRPSIALDEFDFYDLYTRFNCCVFPDPGKHLLFSAPTNDLSDYFAWLNGRRKGVAPNPIQRIDSVLLELIKDLEKHGSAGWSDAVSDLLDLGFTARTTISQSILRAKNRALQGGIRSATLFGTVADGAFGIDFATSADIPLQRLTALTLLRVAEEYGTGGRWQVIVQDATTRAVEHGVYSWEAGAWGRVANGLNLGEELLFATPERRRRFPPCQK